MVVTVTMIMTMTMPYYVMLSCRFGLYWNHLYARKLKTRVQGSANHSAYRFASDTAMTVEDVM